MSTKTVTRALAVLFCILVIFLTGRLLLPKDSPAAPVSDLLPIQRPSEVAKRDMKVGEPHAKPLRKVALHNPAAGEKVARPDKPTTAAVPDPDMELVKGFLTKPLPYGTWEARCEVDKRMKEREKAASRLIKTEVVRGKLMRAYLVKQPNIEEVVNIMKPLTLFRNLQKDSESKGYVDEGIQRYSRILDPSVKNYKLLFALIPDGQGSVEYFSYAARDEREALEILEVELNPKPRQVGITYAPRDGEMGVVMNTTSSWRMDHFFEKEEVSRVRNH